MLEVKNVSLGYGSNTVVQGADLQLQQGEIACLLGSSGCGKTTLLRAIAGFEPVRQGHIVLNGTSVASADHCTPPQQRDIGMVFQDHALFPHLNVSNNVGFGLHRLPAAERKARIAQMLEVVGLQTLAKRWPHELSGGQQQRVALARALAPRPALLLMDEPFSSLDTSMREAIAREVRNILKKAGATAIMVTHDQLEAFAMGDKVGIMAQGKLLQWGTATEVYCQPRTREVATFVGDGVLLIATTGAEGLLHTMLGTLPTQHPHFRTADETHVLVRPENVEIASEGAPATIIDRAFRGSHFLYSMRLEDGQIVMANAPLSADLPTGSSVKARLALL